MTRAQLTERTAEWPRGDALEIAARYVANVRSAPTASARIRSVNSGEGLRALTGLLRSVPRVCAPFSHTPAGDELCNWFHPTRPLPLDRLPVAVLPLPTTSAEYLRGRSKQAMRTNLTHAKAAGLSCADALSPQEVWRSAQSLADCRGQRLEDVILPRPRPGLVRRFAVAYDAAGDPVGLTETIIDGQWAGLAVLVSSPSHADSQLIRYLLMAHTAGALIAGGVSMLVVGGSMLLTSPGTRYFQRRAGFVPVWLRPAPRMHAGAHRRRKMTSTSLTLADLIAAAPSSDQSHAGQAPIDGGPFTEADSPVTSLSPVSCQATPQTTQRSVPAFV